MTPATETASVSIIGEEIYRLVTELFPVCRSITGNGVRDSLKILSNHVPLEIHEVPTGTRVFDWTVPREWNIRDAYIKDPAGRKIVDFQRCNLHVLNYSTPVNQKISLNELKRHLYTDPEHPDWIPYRTSYYSENWGFCVAHKQLLELSEGEYQVYIDSSLDDGHLTYGEYFLKGKTDAEFLISTHVCHPSLANDNSSGMASAAFLAKQLSRQTLNYSYRFLFIPGTIGSITWLSLNEAQARKIKHGLVVTGIGSSANFTYKKSRRGNAEIDRAVMQVLRESGDTFAVREFSPYGYDERQFCSPGFNLPVGCWTRTPHGEYPQYHTSGDDLQFVQRESLADFVSKCLAVVQVIEENRYYVNQNPKCEPQLGKRGVYDQIGGQNEAKLQQLAMLWVLNFSDGTNSLLDIAEKSTVPFAVLHKAARVLLKNDLLSEAPIEESKFTSASTT